MALEINVPNLAISRQQLVLDGKVIVLELNYNYRNEAWHYGLYDNIGQPIVAGIRLVEGATVGGTYIDDRLPDGIFFVANQGKEKKITRENLGTDFILLYIPKDEVDAAII